MLMIAEVLYYTNKTNIQIKNEINIENSDNMQVWSLVEDKFRTVQYSITRKSCI